ncbi:hypothetical protein [Kribbella sp. NPDC048915]|uniref:hypothetical protein n=1 Tax=Kribbella sp. NPDC048915 TaxID=3155148 RepID=UPI0033F8C5B5
MPRRPLLAAVATLSTLTLLTACNGSPEAGRPNTNPVSPSSTPTPTPTAPSSPTWTPEQQAAITAAKTRYAVAMAAIDRTFMNPKALDRPTLEQAGISGEWILTIVDQARTLERSNLYVTGSPKTLKSTVASVKLQEQQPEIVLVQCVDTSTQIMRFRSNGKPVQSAPGSEPRRQIMSLLRYAPNLSGKKMWFLIRDEDKGTC